MNGSPVTCHHLQATLSACMRACDNFFFSCTCAPLSSQRLPSLAHSGFRAAIKSPPPRAVHGRKTSAPAADLRQGPDTRGHLSDGSGRNRGDAFVLLAPPVRGSKRRWLRFPAWNQSLNCLPFIYFFCRYESTKRNWEHICPLSADVKEPVCTLNRRRQRFVTLPATFLGV